MKNTQKIAVLLLGSLITIHSLGSYTIINNNKDSGITTFEKESMAFMREEEKLAFDVYSNLFSTWNLRPLQNISKSESSHMAAVKVLLEQFELNDPSNGKSSGIFMNPHLQQLYNSLMNKGNVSETESLKVGANIEEIDIRDLKDHLLKIKNEDIRIVYNNLLRGSGNHLRAFVSNLSRRGFIYKPQYLTQQEFDEIINSQMEMGGMNRGNRGMKNQNQ